VAQLFASNVGLHAPIRAADLVPDFETASEVYWDEAQAYLDGLGMRAINDRWYALLNRLPAAAADEAGKIGEDVDTVTAEAWYWLGVRLGLRAAAMRTPISESAQ
jgi:hypothetical protein